MHPHALWIKYLVLAVAVFSCLGTAYHMGRAVTRLEEPLVLQYHPMVTRVVERERVVCPTTSAAYDALHGDSRTAGSEPAYWVDAGAWRAPGAAKRYKEALGIRLLEERLNKATRGPSRKEILQEKLLEKRLGQIK